jgi:hypothetical protein
MGRLNAKCAALKREIFERAAKDGDQVETDNVLHRNFESLFNSTKSWSVKAFVSRLDSNHMEGLKAVMADLSENDCISSATAGRINSLQAEDTPARVLFNMLLNEFICYHIFRRPFAYLKRTPDDWSDRDIEDSMGWIVSMAMQGK